MHPGDAQVIMDKKRLKHEKLSFDYLRGRVMKVNIEGDEMSTAGYNRDNGLGAAEAVIQSIRERQNLELKLSEPARPLEVAAAAGDAGEMVEAASTVPSM